MRSSCLPAITPTSALASITLARALCDYPIVNMSEQRQQGLKQAFARLDADGSGSIERKEVEALLTKAGLNKAKVEQITEVSIGSIEVSIGLEVSKRLVSDV